MKEKQIIAHYVIVKALSRNPVYLVRDRDDGKQYVLSLFSAAGCAPEKDKCPFTKAVQHRNLIPVHEILLQNSLNDYGVVVDFCENGSLSSIMDRYQIPSQEYRLSVLMDVTRSLAGFFECGESHYDGLSLKNIFHHDSAFKISPLFYSEVIVNLKKKRDGKSQGKLSKYAPPKGEKSEKSMIWSLGVVFLEVLTWKKMPEGEDPSKYFAQSDEIGLTKTTELLRRMLAKEESDRIEFNDVRQSLSSLLQVSHQGKSVKTVKQLQPYLIQKSEILRPIGKNIGQVSGIAGNKIMIEKQLLQSLLLQYFQQQKDKISGFLEAVEGRSGGLKDSRLEMNQSSPERAACSICFDLSSNETIRQVQKLIERYYNGLEIQEAEKLFRELRDSIKDYPLPKEQQPQAKWDQIIEVTIRQGCLLSTKAKTLTAAEGYFKEAIDYCEQANRLNLKSDIHLRLAKIRYESNENVSKSLDQIDLALEFLGLEKKIQRREEIKMRIQKLIMDVRRFETEARISQRLKKIEAKMDKQMQIGNGAGHITRDITQAPIFMT